MRIPSLPRAAVLAAIVMSGCAEQPSPTAPAGPPDPRFTVERGQTDFGGGFDDGSRVLFAGQTLENLTNLFCGGPFDLDQLHELAVIRPDGTIKDQLRGEANVVVVDAPPEIALTCDGLRTAPHLTGTARIVLNDNDALGSGTRANAFGFHVVGTVTDAAGQRFHLVAFIEGVLGSPSGLPDRVRTTIQLTPIGR